MMYGEIVPLDGSMVRLHQNAFHNCDGFHGWLAFQTHTLCRITSPELHTEIDSMSVPRSYRMCVAAVAISFRIYCVLHIHLRREIYVIFLSDQGIENIWCDVVYYNIHSVIVSLSFVLSNGIEFRWKFLNDYTQATATEISMSICEISTIFQSLL